MLYTSSQSTEILGLTELAREQTEQYGLRNGLAVKSNFDTTNLFVANLDIEKDFVGDQRTFRCKNDINKEKEREKHKR